MTTVTRTFQSTPAPKTAATAVDSGVMDVRPFLRPNIRGKFLYVGDEKFYVRGVTYGPFKPTADGCEYKDPDTVNRDFALMAKSHINAVRVYTPPPLWLLNLAQQHGLRVMVGLPWEQHIAFLNDKGHCQDVVERVRAAVRSCAKHPAILCYAVGNEIPASIVRWYGAERMEAFIYRLFKAVKREDPDALVTYVNFPTTEYLDLPFVDLVCFNVYLETREKLRPYLARLHNIAGEKPLMMAEVGLDSMRNGEEAQASTLSWQVKEFFAAGACGGFVFAWTDEWFRGGHEIEDWAFGLTTRKRQPKPALAAVADAFANVPFKPEKDWPKISIVCCSYNGAKNIRATLEGIRKLEYPNFETIVVDDGSKDNTSQIARELGFEPIRTENRGLSSARNTGWQAATGEIVAYIDDDAIPDPHWLQYLGQMFRTTEHAGIGGPNLTPLDSETISDCVSNSPGGPTEVLLTDEIAEHIPGCNMAFRRAALEAIGGFDTTFRIAGDDVDVCWRMQKQGWTLGFCPSAVVWHKRRNSVKAYLKQQFNYGRSEALLELKWPEKYNTAGHMSWHGRIYGKGVAALLHWRRQRIYHGVWGTAAFQSVYQPAPDILTSLPHIPEFYLIIVALAGLTAMGVFWPPLLFAAPFLLGAICAVVGLAVLGARRAEFVTPTRSVWKRARMRTLTGLLHLLQPIVRLWGRMKQGLTPWRKRGSAGAMFPWDRTLLAWYETWKAPEDHVRHLEVALQKERVIVYRGSEHVRWDLELRGGLLGGTRLSMAIEEHGSGKQLVLVRMKPTWSAVGVGMIAAFGVAAAMAATDAAADRQNGLEIWWVAGVLLAICLLLTARALWESGAAIKMVVHALKISAAEALAAARKAAKKSASATT